MMQYVPTKDLRPTQITIGIRYVEAKAVITARHSKDIDAFMARHAVRVVIGPRGSLYVVDHHHWACAWLSAGRETVPVEIVADLGRLDDAKFWKCMAKRQWVHPFDTAGVRCSVDALPSSLTAMVDDAYHSLSAFARRAGAYRKPRRAYASFVWTDFLREHVPIHGNSDGAFTLALVKAIQLARSKQAAGMPGYIGR